MSGLLGGHRNKAFWSAVEAAAAPLSAIMLSAGMLRTLGSDEFGIYVVIQSFSLLSLTLSPAIAATTMRFIASAQGDVAGKGAGDVQAILASACLAVAVLGLLLVAAVAVFRAPISGLLFGGLGSMSRVQAALVVAVAAIAIQQLDAVFGAALKGLHQFSVQGIFEALFRPLVALAMVAAAVVSGDIITALLVQLAGATAGLLVRAWVLRQRMPGCRLTGRVSSAALQPLMQFGGWMWLNATATSAFGTVDRIVINRLLGAAPAAEYHIYAQVLQLIHYVPASILAFSFPLLSTMFANAGTPTEQIAALHRRTFWLAAACGVVGGGLLLLFGGPLLQLLMGEAPGSLPPTYLVLAVVYSCLAFNIGAYYVLLAAGRSRAVSLVTTLSIVAALVVLVPLVHSYGLVGAAWSRGVYALGALLLIPLALRLLREKGRHHAV